MSLITRFRNSIKAFSKDEEELLKQYFAGGSSTHAGVTVNNDTAMRQATVFACLNIISRSIGQLPCHLHMRQGDRTDKADSHPLYDLLSNQPNEWMTAPEFWGMAALHLAARGNFFALKVKVGKEIRELIPLAPGVVEKVEQNDHYKLSYYCRFPGKKHTLVEVPAKEIMHLRGMVGNGYMGMNPVHYIRESIGLGLATEEFGARYFGSGTHPGVIFEHPGKFKDDAAARRLRDSLHESYSGLGKAHRTMLLEEGMKAHMITINPEDSQFLETRKYQKMEIVDIFFGMPLTVMASGEKAATYASAEQFSISFIVYALMPWIVNIEKAIGRDLLTMNERKAGYYAKFNVNGLLRGSFKDQIEAFVKAINAEIMNPNECRALMDMNPYTGGEEFKTRTSSVREAENGDNATNADNAITDEPDE